mmetsp:Transcript_76208/g.227140  ORF Transcript_76208/g.227140 Transcript_76208/m.227140 type:complete len:269 (-) Transcript_76208:169-975(-)
MLPSATAPGGPAPPTRSPEADSDESRRSGSITSTGSVTRLMDSARNSLRISATAANSASRSVARSAVRLRPARFALSRASERALSTFGQSATNARREARSWMTLATLVLKVAVALDQKCAVREATPSTSSTDEKLLCVMGSVLFRSNSSSTKILCTWAMRSCRFTSKDGRKFVPAGSTVCANSSNISVTTFSSCGQRHCRLKNTCRATLSATWLACLMPLRRSSCACLRTRTPDSRIQKTSARRMSTFSRLLSCRMASSSRSVCAAFE